VIASLIILAGIILLATVSYEFFEKPILRRKQRFEVEKTRI
jgi:peptidoglycan/LPS O-acetylase OafA/YrhL